MEWLKQEGPGLVFQAILFLVILLVFRFLGGILGKITGRAMSHSRLNVTQLLREVVSGHDKVLADPAPVIKVHELADSSVNFVVRPWCRTSHSWDVYSGGAPLPAAPAA